MRLGSVYVPATLDAKRTVLSHFESTQNTPFIYSIVMRQFARLSLRQKRRNRGL